MSDDLTQRLRDEIERLTATVADQRRTIDALMIGMPDDGTTPVIRRIAALEGERDALAHEGNNLINELQAMTDERDDLEAERDALEADAERYQFLRTSGEWPAVFGSHLAPEPLRGDYLDAAIDAARGGGKT